MRFDFKKLPSYGDIAVFDNESFMLCKVNGKSVYISLTGVGAAHGYHDDIIDAYESLIELTKLRDLDGVYLYKKDSYKLYAAPSSENNNSDFLWL